MDKEALTPQTVRRCLREVAFSSLLSGVLPGVAFAVSLVLTILIAPNLFAILFAVITAYYGVYFLILIANGIAALMMSLCRPILVKSTRVKPAGEKEMYYQPRVLTNGRYQTGHILHFHGYGKRHVPSSMYVGFDTWLSDLQIWECTNTGDEFYLLLDRFDRIMYFFPCKNFEYVGELTPNKYER